ncbi:single-stranded-DNA-specific exonuclease RecJ [Candidatus Roizmanbacteria bacterium]|nr:single-stranded-DNA-specific exonuclease RecJ [Candidatus Roizmanbacteria bacterium]
MKITFKHEIKADDKIKENDLIEILLKNRKIKDKNVFLNPLNPSEINLSDFGFKREIEKTLRLLEKLKKDDKMIVVYTDYDADGITGGAILWETLHLLGFKVMPYVPHRKLEGYGFSIKGIDKVKKQYNPSLIISVDHGITAKEKISYAKKLGIQVIVTDHHLKPEKLPDEAAAIFHIPELSGSGVAYLFAKAIFEQFSSLSTNYKLLTTHFQSDYLALSSIGTIADLVPLIGPSRSIVKFGLEAFSKTKRVGLKHILQEAGIMGRKITPYEIGYIIAPRINAVGRLEHAIDALRLLCTTRDDKAYHLATRVGTKNRERQDLVVKAVEEAKEIVRGQTSNFKHIPNIIIIKNENFHEGIIGLIASKIAEEYYRPTIVLTESDGFLKASARSIPQFHITNFLREQKRFLIDVGGHKQAAGFTMEKVKFTTFNAIVLKVVNKLLKDKDLVRTIEVDIKIPLSKLNLSIAKQLEILQPFGIGNPKPTFYSEVEVTGTNTFGKTNNHLKIFAKDPKHNSSPLEFISFGNGNNSQSIAKGQKANIVYNLEVDRWGGNEKLRGKIVKIVLG